MGTPSTRDRPANSPHQLLMLHHVSRVASIVPIKQPWRTMQEDKPAMSFNGASKKKRNSHLALHFSLVISLTLCSSQPPAPPPPFLPYNMMVSLLPGNLLCDVVHTSMEPKERKKKFLDQIQYDDLPRWCVSLLSWSYG